MKRIWTSGALVALFACTTGCVGLKVVPQSLDKVKTVAIVSLSVSNSMNSGGTGTSPASTYAGVSNMVSAFNGDAALERRTRAEGLYDAFADKVSGAGFTMIKRAEITANAKFHTTFVKLADVDATDEPSQFVVQGARLNMRDAAVRSQLIEALGVDAIAETDISFVTGKTEGVLIGGFGSLTRFPQAMVTIKVYDRTSPDPIWVDYRVAGQTAHAGIQDTMGVSDTSGSLSLFIEATSSAVTELVTRYQKARAEPPPKS